SETLCVRFRLENLALGGAGVLLSGTVTLSAWWLCRRPLLHAGRPRRLSVFLALWLALEVAGYLVLTPFPAVRRALGVGTVALLLVGRLAARPCRAPARRLAVQGCAAAGIVLGLGFFTVDLLDARAAQLAVRALPQPGHERVWYLGDWGF